jgi:hypothetical protein
MFVFNSRPVFVILIRSVAASSWIREPMRSDTEGLLSLHLEKVYKDSRDVSLLVSKIFTVQGMPLFIH